MSKAELMQSAKTDRRRHQRQPANLMASVSLGGPGMIPCKVLNISAMGAMLEFAGPVILPQTFHLRIDQDFFECGCEIRHQNGLTAGLLFTSNRQRALATYGD